jgi:hypothetical protein
MIEFKIISSPDKSQQATYQHLGRELTLGRTEGDMIVDDPAFGDLQIKIVIQQEKGATIENLNTSLEVRLNGKAIMGPMPLKEKDNITVSRTTINFSRLDLGPMSIPEPYEMPTFKERFTKGSKELIMLDVLEHLENATEETALPPPAAAGARPPLPPGASAGKPPIPPGGAPKPPLPPGSGAMPPPLPKKS